MSLKGNAAGHTVVGKINGLDTLTISAYGIAVKNGFEGTEEEWLASLKGDKGDKGEKGDIGYYDGEVITAEMVHARPDTWLPTIAEIGAAPGNYGLGGDGVGITDANTAVNNGWYYTGESTANLPDWYIAQYSALFVTRRGTTIYQTLTMSAVYGYSQMVRYSSNGGATWNEWEWVNPPMLLGVEYRTTERWNGKTVYAQLVDCGNLPNASQKNVTFPNATTYEKIISVSCYAYSPTLGGFNLPYIDSTGTSKAGYVLVGNYIRFFTTFDTSSMVCKALIKYTKD